MTDEYPGKYGTLFLVHGALSDERMWRDHLDLLKDLGDVRAVTLPDFGPEESAEKSEFGMNSHAERLAKIVGDPRISGPVHLVAWSYGADVALNALVRHHGKIASVMVYEPGYPGCLTEEEMRDFGKDAGAMFGPVFTLAEDGELHAAVEALVDGSGNRLGYFASQPETARAQQLDNAHTLPRQLHQQETPDLDAGHLSKVEVPVTVAWGESSRPLFRIVSQAVARTVANGRAVPVHGATHMLPVEDPRRFADLVRDHLGGLKS
ncbi:alpha/beta hydrolase [Pseudodesulfovibrio indicus]|uniref:alpha/beta fold hydrolase n=1 Tax=Pseudodesulfovibrio indicus TaxID=1716143 RepID=UPI00292E597A|nr:alpha/beta hydrolase [Pseudodesulfovibrio indicus]